MRSVSFIQVGVGNRGAEILDHLTVGYADRLRPAAFVDIVPDFFGPARAISRLDRLPHYATLDEALAAHPDAEAVVIATPAALHAGMVREALLADRHVWVEKPLTYDLDEALGLARLARERSRAVVVGNQYHPLERRLQAMVRERRYGRPFFVSYIHHRHRPEMRAFTGTYPALWEQGVHSLDSILAILGDARPASVYALGLLPPHSGYNSDTVTNVLTRFVDGVQAHLLVTFDSHRSDWSIRVECERAALHLRADGWERDGIEVLIGEEIAQTVRADEPGGPAPAGGPADPYSGFLAEIETGRPAPTSIARNLKTLQWIDAARSSLVWDAVVRVDPLPSWIDPEAVPGNEELRA